MAERESKTKSIVTIAAVTFSGGLFDDERTTVLAHRVVRLSMATAFLFLLDQILAVSDPVTQALLNNEILVDADKNATTDPTTIFPEDYDQDKFVALFYITFVFTTLAVLMIPLCGYKGAKSATNQGTDFLRWFCACSGACGACSLLSLLGFVVSLGYGSATCSAYENAGFDPTICNIRAVLLAIMAIVFILNAFFSNTLIKARDIMVINTFNSVNPHYTTKTVIASPVQTPPAP